MFYSRRAVAVPASPCLPPERTTWAPNPLSQPKANSVNFKLGRRRRVGPLPVQTAHAPSPPSLHPLQLANAPLPTSSSVSPALLCSVNSIYTLTGYLPSQTIQTDELSSSLSSSVSHTLSLSRQKHTTIAAKTHAIVAQIVVRSTRYGDDHDARICSHTAAARQVLDDGGKAWGVQFGEILRARG